MIIFINGPFGVGKTTTARLLAQRLPGAVVYNPEHTGALLRTLLRRIKPARDYQDYALWRLLVVLVPGLLSRAGRRTVVIPMTVTRRDYFAAITAGLRRVDPVLVCVRLTAPRDVVEARMLGDTADPRARGWRLAHLEAGLAAASDPAFGSAVPTEGRTPEEVTDAILRLLALGHVHV